MLSWVTVLNVLKISAALNVGCALAAVAARRLICYTGMASDPPRPLDTATVYHVLIPLRVLHGPLLTEASDSDGDSDSDSDDGDEDTDHGDDSENAEDGEDSEGTDSEEEGVSVNGDGASSVTLSDGSDDSEEEQVVQPEYWIVYTGDDGRRRTTGVPLSVEQVHVTRADDVPTEHDTCCVCLDTFRQGDMLSVLECTHMLHAVCFADMWVHGCRSCPVCRAGVPNRPRMYL